MQLLERHDALASVAGALADATRGQGRVVLIGAEAGLGKTSLVRAFLADLDRVRVLEGACDDLATPRTLGPFHDLAGSAGPAVRAGLAGRSAQPLFAALLDELNRGNPTTVLVVEDLHWADQATLDALACLARRVERCPALLLLTYRDDEVVATSPLQRLLGTLRHPVAVRVPLAPLSVSAVTALAGAAGAGLRVHAAAAGNPFFVTELLAADEEGVPASVADAVLARVAPLPAATRALLEQLAVVPGGAETELLDVLCPGWAGDAAPAEQRGIAELRGGALRFRHELARLAIADALPEAWRRELDRAVLTALLQRDPPERARVLHHAGRCGDVDAILQHGPAAAREAAAAGAHRQALAHYEQLLPLVERLSRDEQAAVHEEHAWELYNAHRFTEAVTAAGRAVAIREALGAPAPLAQALVTLSWHSYISGDVAVAGALADRAVHVLGPAAPPAAVASVRAHRGVLLVLADREEEGLAELAVVQELAADLGARDLAALCLNYRGQAATYLGDANGLDLVRRGIAEARAAGHDEYEARGYTGMVKALIRLGRTAEVLRWVEEGLDRTSRADFHSHAYMLEAHRHRLAVQRGDWAAAEAGLRELVTAVPDAGILGRETLPVLARILARRGDPEAEQLIDRAWEFAVSSDALLALAPAGLAAVEHAWLRGDPDRARPHAELLLARTDRRGAERYRGELLRYLRRAGHAAAPFDGCPPEYAAGLRGDWRAAAAAWERIGDPYERALELAESGEVQPTLEALRVLDALGAKPAARLVRVRLRGLGVQRVPRGPLPATRLNPAGLTERQLDVLGLLADGLTNAEIADRLVVSVRTIDHHVSAILDKLDVRTRQEAARAAAQASGSGSG